MVANDGGEPTLETEAWLLVRIESSSYIGGLGGSGASGGNDGSGTGLRQRVPQPHSSEDGFGSGVGRRLDASGSSSGSGSGSGRGGGWMSNSQNTKLLLVFCIAIVLLVVIVCVVALLYLKYYYFDVSASASASGDRRSDGRRGTLSGPGSELYAGEALDAEKRALDLSNNAGSNTRDRRCLPMSQNLLQGGGSLRSNRDHVVPAVGATLQSTAARSRTGTAVGVRGLPPQAQTIFVPIGPSSDRSRSVTPSRAHAVAVKRPDAAQVLIHLLLCKFMNIMI